MIWKKILVEINEICEENIYTCFILQEVQIVVYVFIFNDIWTNSSMTKSDRIFVILDFADSLFSLLSFQKKKPVFYPKHWPKINQNLKRLQETHWSDHLLFKIKNLPDFSSKKIQINTLQKAYEIIYLIKNIWSKSIKYSSTFA